MQECSCMILDSDNSAALFQGSQGKEPHILSESRGDKNLSHTSPPGEPEKQQEPHGSVQ